MQNTSNMYNTTCLKDVLGDGENYPTMENWEVDEKVISGCAIGGHIDGQVEEGIPYVAGNTLWAVYQVQIAKWNRRCNFALLYYDSTHVHSN